MLKWIGWAFTVITASNSRCHLSSAGGSRITLGGKRFLDLNVGFIAGLGAVLLVIGL
jgi:hypothetical protein